MIGALVPTGIGSGTCTLVSIGDLLAGVILNVHRPATSVEISVDNALSFLAPLRCSSDPFETSAARSSAPVVTPTARRAEPHPFI